MSSTCCGLSPKVKAIILKVGAPTHLDINANRNEITVIDPRTTDIGVSIVGTRTSYEVTISCRGTVPQDVITTVALPNRKIAIKLKAHTIKQVTYSDALLRAIGSRMIELTVNGQTILPNGQTGPNRPWWKIW